MVAALVVAGAEEVISLDEAEELTVEVDVAVEAGADEVVVEVAVVEAGAEAAVAAQEQTAKADVEASRPVTAPHALTTQFNAKLAMEAALALLHWQT